MASKDISEIHLGSCTILERLYVARGSPPALDAAFIDEYFKRLQEHFNLDTAPDGPEPRAPHATNARLSQQDRGLLDVGIASKNEKFLVTDALQPLRTITGTSQRFGSDRGRGTYIMTSVQGIPNITITTGSAVVAFIGLPNTLQSESGVGEWVSA
ncbi:hypothetical protein HYPSUDRAFT_205043 [Hypholoma sublateritium FD-334 SS-4]|uniref:Uncharacterized protein n=1 Tax=Hypholoma sublateritium (strain FD-334 SS-4) TaxID=945553 RepID=A0A0D2NPX0_HYPSF|nr:hypothetical protein HYPSUDRAFT_205043 [Hypholoma sublateritium FD-334 SS-4]